MGSVRRVITCTRCGYDLSGITSRHYFGDWGNNPHCLPCGKICDKARLSADHTHPQEGVTSDQLTRSASTDLRQSA